MKVLIMMLVISICALTACANSSDDELPHVSQIKVSTFGCRTRAISERITQLLGEHDKHAAMSLVEKSMLSGDCANLNAGDQVMVEDVTIDGLTRVRPIAGVVSYWTVSEVVDP
ncbi:hypothetical protein [Oleiagrimonas soli]|uniref:Lipoprotein n=1 Tax=Oleiagrimonas soli TaxID=1543381 RepID=A0A841KNI2_9GAMM|nr:hypothetical protein [Oleiagrimonas soli]MBB6183534.1 hypothetical protein [Oleiagrimonas soli]